jgi:hypothetical protein
VPFAPTSSDLAARRGSKIFKVVIVIFVAQLRLGKIPPYSAAMPSNPASPLALPRKQQGHSRKYILNRLRREGLHAWVAAVASGKLSCYAAACELGWTTRRPTKRGQNSNQSKRRRFNISKLIG